MLVWGGVNFHFRLSSYVTTTIRGFKLHLQLLSCIFQLWTQLRLTWQPQKRQLEICWCFKTGVSSGLEIQACDFSMLGNLQFTSKKTHKTNLRPPNLGRMYNLPRNVQLWDCLEHPGTSWICRQSLIQQFGPNPLGRCASRSSLAFSMSFSWPEARSLQPPPVCHCWSVIVHFQSVWNLDGVVHVHFAVNQKQVVASSFDIFGIEFERSWPTCR